LRLQDSEQPKKKQKAEVAASHAPDIAAVESLDLASDHHGDAIVMIKQEHLAESPSSSSSAAVAAAAPTAAAAQHAASQQHDTVAEHAPAAAAQGMHDVDVTLTVNTKKARKEITNILEDYHALGAFISQLWNPNTDTLQSL
jgi:hypothetical protein